MGPSTLSIITSSITTLRVKSLFTTLSINKISITKLRLKVPNTLTFNFVMLSVNFLLFF
jgi:hypothetical protein